MRRLTQPYLLLAMAVFSAGCYSDDKLKSRGEAADNAAERESVTALKELGANLALDDKGRVKVLRLRGPKVTDAELAHLKGLTNLESLYLVNTKVTDAGVVHLKPLKRLKTLHCIRSEAGRRIAEELKQPTVVECLDCPLQDVLDYLGDYHGVQFKIDEGELEAGDFPRFAPITAKIEGVPLYMALPSILEPLGLQWRADSSAVVITTKGAAAEKRRYLAELREALPNLEDVLVDW